MGEITAVNTILGQGDPTPAEKLGYDHFMLKEIHEQPQALWDTMGMWLTGESVFLREIDFQSEKIRTLEKIFIIACGTSYHAGLVGREALEKLTGLPVEVDIASEFCYRDPIIPPNSLIIVISQSGTTTDTLVAMQGCLERGVKVIAITNAVNSTISKKAHCTLYTRAGSEIAIAATKSYVTQILALIILALHLGAVRKTIEEPQYRGLLKGLNALPHQVQQLLEQAGDIAELAQRYATHEHIFFIGRGLDYAVAREGALKLKEISYIHAEACAAGELKHGTLALVTQGVPIIALATQPHVLAKTLDNIRTAKERGARIIAVGTAQGRGLRELAHHLIEIPTTHPLLSPILTVLPLQLFAYYAAVKRGCDVDKPRNLTKSVMTE